MSSCGWRVDQWSFAVLSAAPAAVGVGTVRLADCGASQREGTIDGGTVVGRVGFVKWGLYCKRDRDSRDE